MGLDAAMVESAGRVLIVEDSPTEAMLIQAVLEESDHPRFDSVHVTNLKLAFEELQNASYDVVILDLTLPDSTGLATFHAFRRHCPEMPVVVVTANASKNIAMDAIKLGAQDYIVKEQVENMALGLSLRFAIERKRSENEIKQRKKNLDDVIRATPVGMILLNEDLIVQMANQSATNMLGQCEEDLVGQRLGDGMQCVQAHESQGGCGTGEKCLDCILRQTSELVLHSGESVLNLEAQAMFYRHKKEVHPWLDICCSYVEIDGHKHVILAMHDITAKVEAQAIKSRLMSMVSHELRSPLGAMKEATEIVLDELPGPLNEEQLKILEIVKRNLLRLHRLTTDFLDFQKLKAGKMSFELKRGDINQVVEEVRQTMQSASQVAGIGLVVEMQSVPPFYFDKDRLVQVLINLVNNALKFTEHGSVTIATGYEDETVYLTVRDTGCGMAPEEVPMLFQEFNQLSNTKAGGTGLGLAISKKIIEEHGGGITVESELSHGTAVKITLPLRQTRESESADISEATTIV